jgi:amino acid adenylation domain-containing protein
MLQGNEGRGRIPLPGYPFERQRFWIKPTASYLPLEKQGVPMDMAHEEPDNHYHTDGDASSLYARPSTVTTDYQQPADEVEGKLAEIWQDVLGIQSIGVLDNYFELGGDSLIAAQIISRIRKAFNCDLAIQKMFEAPTVESLAKYIKEIESSGQGNLALPLERIEKGKTFPLSLSQERLWFINKIEPYSPAYNIVQATRIKGQLDESILQKALDEIIQRHEVLRTVFKTVDGKAFAELISFDTIKIEKIELDVKNVDDGEKQARSWVRENAPALFDLEQGPLLRAYLFNIGPSENLFVLIMHHIISDGWSMGVWMEELTVIYDALESQKEIPLPGLSIQYSDYAVWHKKWLEQVDIKGQEAYWKNKLSGKLPVMELPSDFPRPAEAKYSGSAKFFSIPANLTRELKDLGKKQETSLYNLMLSTLMVFLYKHSGQNDMIIGVPYANRELVELEKLIGFFLNMLPIRAELDENESFLSLVKKVHTSSFEALANKDVPFEKLVKITQPERSLNYHPLFQVMFAFQNFPIPIIEKTGLTFFPSVFDRGATEFDFALYMWEDVGELKGIFEYSLELFKPETIVRMTAHYLEMIKGVVSEPDAPISKINILPEKEKRQLLVEWNNTDRPYPDDKCMHQLFEMQAEKTPDAVAIQFEQDTMTYRELNRRANLVAVFLIQKGVGPESFVGIFIERSLNMVVGLLGILKAGGAYVPLDPDYPKERLAYMLENSEAKVLISQESLKEELPKSNAEVICMENEWDAIEALAGSSGIPEDAEMPRPENLAYVIFTSGSTGKPKGVQITHRCLVNFLTTMAREPGFTSEDVLLAVTTLSFDIAGLELFLPIITGGKTIIVSKDVSSDGMQLMETLQASNATVMQATPSTWRILLAAGWEGDQHLKILCGGEAFPKDLVKELTERSGSVWNMYGPTETTIWSTCYKLIDADHPILIGKPIGNTKIYILDDQKQPVPLGAYGELYIGGASVARGYLNRPDLTERQFSQDPFSQDPSDRMYRTGDLVRYHADGNIEYVSRLDNQVKVRGFRIELGEIEFVLEQIEGVKESAAVVKEERPGDARIIAFIVFKPGHELTGSKMRECLRRSLPDYMIPNHFVEVEVMPLTPAGKVNRKQLHESFVFGGMRNDNFVEPQTESEKVLAKIWREEVGVERVSAHDNFFDIGGHSLLAVQVIARVLKETNVQLTPRDIFLNTLSQIAHQYDLVPISDATSGNEKLEGRFAKFLRRFRNN